MDIIGARVKYKLGYRYLTPSIITYLEIPLKDSIHELGKPYLSIYLSIYLSTNSTLLWNWQGNQNRRKVCIVEDYTHLLCIALFASLRDCVIASVSEAISKTGERLLRPLRPFVLRRAQDAQAQGPRNDNCG